MLLAPDRDEVSRAGEGGVEIRGGGWMVHMCNRFIGNIVVDLSSYFPGYDLLVLRRCPVYGPCKTFYLLGCSKSKKVSK